MTPTLAVTLAVLTHPIGLLTLLGLGLVGMAIASSSPLQKFGALTIDTYQALMALAGSAYSTYAAGVTAGTIPANVVTGALTVYLNSAATTPGNQTTRTATQLYADLIAEFGFNVVPQNFTWEMTITQTGAGTLTLVGGTGVTISGTATVAQNTCRTWVCQFTGTPTTPTFTFTAVAVGTIS